MNQNIENTLLERFIPFIGKPSKLWYVVLSILFVVVLIGFYAFLRQEIDGHDITGMRDHVVWGVYIINFIFLLGISYAGAMISSIFHLARIPWGKSLIRILELISFTTLLIAPIYILLCIGRLDRLHYLFIHARIQSPITWDIIAIMADLLFCAVYLYMTHIKDFALLRESSEKLDIAKWRKKLYRILSLGYKGTELQEKKLGLALDIMASIIIPTSIVAYSLLAWLFGMNVRPGWNNSIFAPFFVLTAVYSGFAIIIILAALYRKIYKIKDYISDKHIYFLSYGLFILSLFFGYFTFSEFITDWYNPQKDASILLDKLLSFSEYGLSFYFVIIIGAFLPMIVIGIKKFRNVRNIVVTSVLVLIALWVKRYLIIVPILETPYMPIVDARPEFFDYSATWVEWSLTIAGFAFMIAMMMILNKMAPVLSITELMEKKEFKLFGNSYPTLPESSNSNTEEHE